MGVLSAFNSTLRRRPLSSSLAALVVALLAMVGFARYWITTDAGRDFVISQVDGREIAGYGKLSIRNIEGDPLSDFSVGQIEIRDTSGAWVSAKSIQVSWSPFALLSRRVDLDTFAVESIDINRRPVRTSQTPSSSKAWEVRLGNATIDRLHIAEGVAGPESASSISARFLTARNGTIDARLRISPLEGAGDEIDARIKRDSASAFELQIDGIAPADGLFAHLLHLPEGSAAVLAASAAGDLSDGRGEARLSIDGADKVLISGKIENNTLEASARFDATSLPLAEKLSAFLGPQAEADLLATFEKKSAAVSLDARIAAGKIKLAGKSRLDRLEFVEPASLEANLTTLLPYWEGADGLQLNGTLTKQDDGYQYSGDATLRIAESSSLPFETVSGPVTATLEDGRIPFSANVIVTKPVAGNATFAGILGEQVHLSGTGVYELASRRLLLDAIELTHKTGTAQLLGEANFRSNDLNLTGKISQDIAALPGGLGGTASGFVQAKGQLRDFDLSLNLNLANVTSRLETLSPLVKGRGTLRGVMSIKPDEGAIQKMELKLPGLQGQVSGRAYGARAPDLSIEAEQLEPLLVSGNQINLGSISARLRRTFAGLRLSGTSQGGRAVISGRTISSLVAKADLLLDDGTIAGPVTLAGVTDGQPATASFILDRRNNTTRISSLDGQIGAIDLSGSAAISDSGSIEANIDADASTFSIGGVRFGSLTFKTANNPAGSKPSSLGASFEATDVMLTSRMAIDKITGSVTSTPAGYRFEGRILDDKNGAESDVTYSGLFWSGNETPSGTLALTGRLFGAPISTRKDITWTMGSAPTADVDLSVLGGQIQARVRPGSSNDSSSLVIDKLALSPALAAFGLPEIDAVISGDATGRLYGETPEGRFTVTGTSGLSGLKTALDLTLNGKLDRRALAFTAEAAYGPELNAAASGRLPVMTAPAAFVKLDRSKALEAVLDLEGNLEALRLVALAYGHDIGGVIDSHTEIAGSLDNPKVTSNAVVSNGIYEYGATGLSLKDLEIKADYRDLTTTLSGTGAGTQGGSITFDGRLAETETGVKLKFDRLLVYDKLGDQARISGDAQLVEGADDRVLSGALTINDAKFNIDNFSDDSIRTLNVRWDTDDADAARQTILNKPIRLDMTVSAKRGVIVRGRGLDSDWGVNVAVKGTPSSLLLSGRATLVRGTLELARRPFEFQTGQITFDGPPDSARMAISATREVDGFSVSADVSGTVTDPTVELSSSPSLPEDEILSRMLFGRSSVDLSALEAAELASSIARLAGRDTGVDPIAAIQSGLGVDRLRLGVDSTGNAELGVGQYLAPDVYLEVTTQGAAGNSVEVEWQPRPQVSVASETSSTGESRVSIRWKRDY
jgi:translocation and assembly module TamB